MQIQNICNVLHLRIHICNTIYFKSILLYEYINISNTSTVTGIVNFWISDKSEPSIEDVVEAEIVIDAKQTYVRGPMTLSKLERIFFRTTTEGLVYRIYGYDERKL